MVLSQRKLNITKIVYEFGIDRKTLTRYVKMAKLPIIPTKSLKNILELH
jgi:predicted transcriptional regulator